jgi:large subunit ribosomal protein L29
MPILKIKEISNMSSEDRDKKLSELRTELARLRTMIRAGGAVENPARVRELRKAIAKILTVENESKLGLRETKEKPEKKKAKAKPKRKEKKPE